MARVRKLKLGETEPNDWAERSPEERLLAVWEITRQAYDWKASLDFDVPLLRGVLKVVRRPG